MLNPLQMELLSVYSLQPSESELLDVKNLLGKYFAQRLTQKIDAAVKERNISEDDLNKWLDED